MNVYVVTHVPTKRHYVGKTNNPDKRWGEHVRESRRRNRSCPKFHAAINKYGKEQFLFQVVESFDTEEEAYEAEAFWIELLRSDVCGYGFNLESGGTGGKKVSDETKAAWSVSRRGRKASEETKAKMSLAHKDFRHTPEAKEKIAASKRGICRPESVKEKLRAANTGKKASEETKARMSASQLRRHGK